MDGAETKNVEIVTTPPPFWFMIHHYFPAASLDRQIFAFGTQIHWKHQMDGQKLSLDLVAHEVTHLKQQQFTFWGAVEWWIKYCRDADFRITMELEAYRAQLDAAKAMTNDRNAIFKLANTLADNLSSDIYGSCISKQKAFEKITS